VVPFNKRRCLFVKLYAYSSASSSLSCSYSVDHGASYTTYATVTLTTTPTVHELPLDCYGMRLGLSSVVQGRDSLRLRILSSLS